MSVTVPGERAAEVLRGALARASRRCPAGCPASRCRSSEPAVICPYIVSPACSSSRNVSQSAHFGTSIALAISTRGAPGVGAEHADRLARLHEQRLVVARARCSVRDDRVVGLPASAPPSRPAVDDEVLGPLGDVGVEVVHQHPQRGFLRPRAAGQRRAAWRADLGRGVSFDVHPSRTRPAGRRTCTSAVVSAMSGDEGAVRVQCGTRARIARRRGPGAARGLERRQQVDRLRRADGLDGEHRRDVAANAARLSAAVQPMRHVVLLIARGGDRVDARRDGASALFSLTSAGRGVLGDHEAGVEPAVGGEERRQARGSARVEQPVGPALADRGRARRRRSPGGRARSASGSPWKLPAETRPRPSGEDQRVVGDASQLDGRRRGATKSSGVAGGAVHLRRAAQRVGVLHRVCRSWRCDVA